MNKTRLLIALVLVAAIAAFFIFDLKQYVSLEFFQAQRAKIDAYYAEHPWQTAAIFSGCLHRDGGAVDSGRDDPDAGRRRDLRPRCRHRPRVVCFSDRRDARFPRVAVAAARLGAEKFGDRLAPVNAGIEKEGAFYLFALRLVPLFPFFVVNLVMG